MKFTRVSQFVERLTRWYVPWRDLRNQPFITLESEMDIEEARRLFPEACEQEVWAYSQEHPKGQLYLHTRYLDDSGKVVSQHCRPLVAMTVHAPLEIEVDPWPGQIQ